MKKLYFILCIYFFGAVSSCCFNDGIITSNTIETAKVLLFSFDENGIYPYLDKYNPRELGISVTADSLSSRTEIASNYSTMDKAYARSNPDQEFFTNTIDSLNVITLYDFDKNHPAGSSVNDILLYLDGFGKTFNLNISEQSSLSHRYKFSKIPQNDSLQFKISGRITDKKSFIKTTKLVVLD